MNADGSKNSGGMITNMVRLRIRIMEHKEIMEFLVLDLGKQDMFLGHDWLQFHNPEIDWKNEKLKFTRCPQECFPETMTFEPKDEMEPIDPNEDQILAIYIGYKELLPHLTIEEIQAKSNFATDIAETQQKTRTWEEIVPPAYRKFNKVFEKKTFDALLPRRPWDHAIEIIPGSKMVDCKIYPLNPQEQKELDEFLKEQLETGRIRSSKSLMASPFFFVKKKDRKLRPVQDYRRLNKMTIKNRYPLPLISELIDQLTRAKYFSKMDVRWGYNNIRIKDGDEYKAAFQTNRGLFEPLVMFFGLTNSPATFQTMMNDIFREEIAQGWVIIYMDDILVFSQTRIFTKNRSK